MSAQLDVPLSFDSNTSCSCACESCRCTSIINQYFTDGEPSIDNDVSAAGDISCGCSSSCCSSKASSASNSECVDGCFMKRIRQIYHFEIILSCRRKNEQGVMDMISNLKDQAFISMVETDDELRLYVSGYNVSLFQLMKNLFENNKNARKFYRIKSARTMKVHQVKLKDSSKMKCRGCSSRIEKAFENSSSVAHLYCDLEDQTVTFFFSDESTRAYIDDILKNDLNKVYDVLNSNIEIQQPNQGNLTFKVDGMKCGGCSSKVVKMLKEKFSIGPENVDIDLDAKRVSVKASSTVEHAIMEEIENLGYTCTKFQQYKEHHIKVNGMKCGGCSSKITKALQSDEHVHFVDVDLENKLVSVQCDYDEPAPLIEAIETLGFTCEHEVEIYSVKTSSQPNIVVHVEPSYDDHIMSDNIPLRGGAGYGYSAFDDEVEMHEVGQGKARGSKKCVLSIDGMSCASCVGKIEKSVQLMKGVEKCVVNLITQKGEIQYDEGQISEQKLVEKIESLGYKCESLTEQMSQEKNRLMLSINASDVHFFMNILTSGEIEGIIDVTEAKEKGSEQTTLTVIFDDKKMNARKVFESVNERAAESDIPEAKIIKSAMLKNKLDTLQRTQEIRKWLLYFLLSAGLTIPAMIVAMVFGNIDATKHYLMHEIFPGLPVMTLIMFLLITPVQFIGGFPFFLLSYKAIRGFSLDMNVLIAIATTEAYGYSLFTAIYNMVQGKVTIEQDYFETAGALLMFLSLGRMLESIAKGKTSSALVTLLDLQPSMAVLVNEENNTEKEIDVDLVQEGDILKVIRACKVPVDGVVVSLDGDALVDEQMITGESMPVVKKVGSEVIGGTVNVGDTFFLMKATRVGANSTLSGIAKLVEQAQTDKPQIQGLADKISSWFVPFIVVLSVIVFAIWALLGALDVYPAEWRPENMNSYIFALLLSTSTVIIACPCALGLAVPTATMVGTGLGAKHGILIKGGSPIEIVKRATAVTFDKTGTLTKGELVVDNVEYFDRDFSEADLLRWTAVSESSSEHPIGKALVRYCKEHQTHDEDLFNSTSSVLSEFAAVSGRGLSCKIVGNNVDIGNEQFMIDQECHLPAMNDSNRYQTLVFVAINKRLKALFSLSDEIREESYQVVRDLHKKGLKVFMLTGDNKSAAHYVGNKLEIPEECIFSQLTPAGKTNKVKELQEKKEVVIMIGDGINDSPSLIQADVGVSVGQGTDVAIECAQIILMKNDLKSLVSAISLCRIIYWRIIMNFVWAFGYNFVAIPFAAGVFFPLIKVMIPPWVAGLAMVSSSICVLLSSLSIRLHRV